MLIKDVKSWLRQRLGKGPVSAGILKAEASLGGVTEKLLRTARKALGVVAKDVRDNGRVTGWSWSLPEVGES